MLNKLKSPPGSRQGNILIWLVIAVVTILIVVALVGRGGVKPPAPKPEVDSQVQQLQQLSTSDDLSAIGTDLDNTNLDNLDSELSDVEKDLQNL